MAVWLTGNLDHAIHRRVAVLRDQLAAVAPDSPDQHIEPRSARRSNPAHPRALGASPFDCARQRRSPDLLSNQGNRTWLLGPHELNQELILPYLPPNRQRKRMRVGDLEVHRLEGDR
ncbi:MAG TPA: hypothetical protein PLO61_09040 [Fimbriimonadaceae bacterium]|nr:hypothetical protein [Fimbriimonadaceae bacterium]HRJ33659.1 hypothetical protein [Fimbriimonadaceae bacterium]